MQHNLLLYIFLMALVTYLIRMLPLVLMKKEITGAFMRAFLRYVPYACLAAMTFPAILDATANRISGMAAFVAALAAAFCRRSLLTVALLSSAAALLAELLLMSVQ